MCKRSGKDGEKAGAKGSGENGEHGVRHSDSWSDPENAKFHPVISQLAAVLFWFGYVLAAVLPVVVVAFIYGLYGGMISRRAFTAFFGLIVLDFIVPIQDGYRPRRDLSQLFFRLLGEGGCRYFPARCIFRADGGMTESGSYILASWPHGLLGGGGHFCFVDFHERGFHPICSGASVILYIPFLRRVFAALGFCDVSKASLGKVLDVGGRRGPTYPYNVVHLVVGGIGEMFCTTMSDGREEPSRNAPERIILSKRKGFIKLALQTGADIIPHYTFGANQTYRRAFGPESFLARISSVCQVSLVVWFGRWWLPFGVIPFRVPVLSVVGEVFEVPKIDASNGEKITDELVERVHAEFCSRMRQLFDEYKVVYVKEMGAPKEWLIKELKFENERAEIRS